MSTIGAVPISSAASLMPVPLQTQDPQEQRSVLAAQEDEAVMLKERLATAQGECALLQRRLRDAEGELAAASEAAATATERLGQHALRQGLVLAAGMERQNAERAVTDDELQRMERLLCERDQEIARLRRLAKELDANRLQSSLELRGLSVAQNSASLQAHELGSNISSLIMRLDGTTAAVAAKGPSQRELLFAEEARRLFLARQEEHQQLRVTVEAATSEVQLLEAKERELGKCVVDLDQSLRHKRLQLDSEDQHLVREGEQLRERCAELRRMLQSEQRDAAMLDQRAVLLPQCSAEASNEEREVEAALAAMPGLAQRLCSSGRRVYSSPVPGDILDGRVHALLKGCGGAPGPTLFYRLGHGDYIIDGRRIAVSEMHGQLLAKEGYRAPVPLQQLFQQQQQQQQQQRLPATFAHPIVMAA